MNTMDRILQNIVNAEPGNQAIVVKVTKEEYEALKKDSGFTSINILHGPYGAIKIEIIE